MMSAMWAAYWAEIDDIVVMDYDWGFMAYSLGPDFLRIEHMFVAPALRAQGYALRMVAEAVDIAREQGKKFILTCVTLNNKSAGTVAAAALSMQAQLAAGFTPLRAEAGQIWFSMETGV